MITCENFSTIVAQLPDSDHGQFHGRPLPGSFEHYGIAPRLAIAACQCNETANFNSILDGAGSTRLDQRSSARLLSCIDTPPTRRQLRKSTNRMTIQNRGSHWKSTGACTISRLTAIDTPEKWPMYELCIVGIMASEAFDHWIANWILGQ